MAPLSISLHSSPPRVGSQSRSHSRISNTLVQRPSASFSPFSSTVLTHPRGINCGRHDYRNGDPGPGGCLFHGRLTKAYPVMPTRQDEIKDRGSDASSTTSIRTRPNLPLLLLYPPSPSLHPSFLLLLSSIARKDRPLLTRNRNAAENKRINLCRSSPSRSLQTRFPAIRSTRGKREREREKINGGITGEKRIQFFSPDLPSVDSWK